MRRYPDGIAGKAFFQKDAPSHMPDWIPTYRALVSTRERAKAKREVDFPLVNDELALLWMVNMGCIDMNPWYSRVDRPDRPDFVLFDLDPTPEVPWSQTIEVALLVREAARRRSASSRSRRPRAARASTCSCRSTAARPTRTRARSPSTSPARSCAPTRSSRRRQWSKARRRGVLIDANQNGEGKTIASAYSVRPRPGAPVSTPLAWDEVVPDLDPAAFTMARRARPRSSGSATCTRRC